MTRSARDEAGEIETVGVIGRQLEEAVEKIIQAAIEDPATKLLTTAVEGLTCL